MNQINANLKTLGEMITINDFCDWFFNSNSNITSNIINFLTQNGVNISSVPAFVFNCPALVQYYSNLNQYNNLNSNWVVLFPQLLGTLYQLFANAIPYNQTTATYTIIPTFNQTGVTTISVPTVLKEISAYLGLYQNKILQYMVLMAKYLAQINVMNGGYTNTYQYSTSSGSASQNNNYDVNSFNPVETTATLNINPINVTNGNYSNGVNLPFSVTAGEPAVTITGANYNNHAGASANNTSQTATNNATNLQNFAAVGSGDSLTILRPLIKKISSLFWSLGNDYYPDNTNWGFNIW